MANVKELMQARNEKLQKNVQFNRNKENLNGFKNIKCYI